MYDLILSAEGKLKLEALCIAVVSLPIEIPDPLLGTTANVTSQEENVLLLDCPGGAYRDTAGSWQASGAGSHIDGRSGAEPNVLVLFPIAPDGIYGVRLNLFSGGNRGIPASALCARMQSHLSASPGDAARKKPVQPPP